MVFRALNWVSRIVLAGIFLYSGYIKLQSPLQFAATLTTYQLFPESLILPIITYLPWVEVSLGALLLVGWQTRYVAAATVGLLFMFSVILAVTYFRGIDADCGCFGPGDRISFLTIARDTLFLVPAVFLAAETRIRGRWQSQQN
ncbi:MAG: DoxX family membrane protein [Acidobacteriia bacterium]|nr:DoxX family membrane protein [Terriglobia bacterium]